MYPSEPGWTVALCSSLFLIPGIHDMRIIFLSEKGRKHRGMLIKAASGIFSGRNPVLYLRYGGKGREGRREGGREEGGREEGGGG